MCAGSEYEGAEALKDSHSYRFNVQKRKVLRSHAEGSFTDVMYSLFFHFEAVLSCTAYGSTMLLLTQNGVSAAVKDSAFVFVFYSLLCPALVQTGKMSLDM